MNIIYVIDTVKRILSPSVSQSDGLCTSTWEYNDRKLTLSEYSSGCAEYVLSNNQEIHSIVEIDLREPVDMMKIVTAVNKLHCPNI